MVAITDQVKARVLDLTTGCLELVRDGKRNPEQVCDVLQTIKDHPDFARRLGLPKAKTYPEPNILPIEVTVDGRSVEAWVEAGNYNWKNPNINSENFSAPARASGKVQASLVHFDRLISSEDALSEIDERGFRAGDLWELLAVGAQHPQLQRKYPIVALGSVWQASSDGDRSVPELWNEGRERRLYLNWFENDWLPYCRFLAARK